MLLETRIVPPSVQYHSVQPTEGFATLILTVVGVYSHFTNRVEPLLCLLARFSPV